MSASARGRTPSSRRGAATPSASAPSGAARCACKLRPGDQALLRTLMAEPALSCREISDALGVPVGSIGPTRARCIERLRRERELAGSLHETSGFAR